MEYKWNLRAKNIADYFKSQRIRVSVDTVLNYIRYLEQALILHQVRRFDIKGKRVLEVLEKYYPADHGLRNGLSSYRDDAIAGLLENLVCVELLRQGYKVHIGQIDGLEIDFIAEKQSERLYLQVAYLIDNTETKAREFSSLAKTGDHFPKAVLSMNPIGSPGQDGIRHLFLPDFLYDGNAKKTLTA